LERGLRWLKVYIIGCMRELDKDDGLKYTETDADVDADEEE
jgi:hypothetical protein